MSREPAPPIATATPDELPLIRDLVARCGLPTDDVRDAPGACQLVWREDGAAAGARTLVLLTGTADTLAQACGWEAVSRCALGDGGQVFRQFAAGCCAEARCYVKRVVSG